MMQRNVLAICCGLALLAMPTRLQAADLASARTLYASASYEEALAMLAAIEAPDNLEPVNQMRALCYVALGRTREAEQAIERITLHNPGYAIDAADVSPKVVSLFRAVRVRTLPTVARTLYAQAKISFDEKRWDAATEEFTKMLAIVDDPDLVEQRGALTDLRQLGEGFLKLSEAQLASAAAKAPAPVAAAAAAPPPQVPPTTVDSSLRPTVTPSPSSGSPPPTVSAERSKGQGTGRPANTGADSTIYTAQNSDVVPPVELQRAMPRWAPGNRLVAQSTYRGLIEIIIDERGAVEAAKMAKSVMPMYDDLLLQSARSWRYMPAKKDGRPVRYRQVLEILLRPSQED